MFQHRVYFFRSYALFLRADFLPADFFLPVLFFLPEDFFAVFFAPLFLLAAFFLPAFFFVAFFGTLAPFSLASDNPIAIACLRLFTVAPLLPLFKVPFFLRRIALSTVLFAFFEYLAIYIVFQSTGKSMPCERS